jgi:DnaJ domain
VIEAYPLTWPVNRPRAKYTQPSKFKTTLGSAIRAVRDEVARLGGNNLIISSNLPLRRDGIPYANASQPADRGVAVYFTHKKRPMCFACDRWSKVEENMWAIAKTIDALRGIERWGSGQMVEQAFTGFVALPAPEQPWQVLGVSSHATREEIETAHGRLAMKHHPDRGGDTHTMARINAARDALLKELT